MLIFPNVTNGYKSLSWLSSACIEPWFNWYLSQVLQSVAGQHKSGLTEYPNNSSAEIAKYSELVQTFLEDFKMVEIFPNVLTKVILLSV